jgi:hypothetical protein
MNRCAKPFLCLFLSALSLFAAFPATARADESNKTILSRNRRERRRQTALPDGFVELDF